MVSQGALMNIWRMKLRAGSHGEDMWPACRKRGVAVITHPPIYNTDLTKLNKSDLDAGVKTAARSSIWLFAWDMQGGDIIFIGDSVSKSIIAKGYLTCKPGTRAYRYNSHDPVREQENLHAPWRHEVAVAWDDDFVPFGYKDGAPQHTVMRFDPTWTCASLGGTEDEGEAAFLTETAYLRKTRASEKNVLRLHAALSNRFRAWLKRRFQVTAIQEVTLPSECVALSWAGLEDFISPRGRRGGGNVGIGFIDFQGLWEGRETARSFSSLSMNRHFHGLPRSA
jgi:hypothetical protein